MDTQRRVQDFTFLFFSVHVSDYQNKKDDTKFVVTTVKKIDGDIFQLRKDIDKFLLKRYYFLFLLGIPIYFIFDNDRTTFNMQLFREKNVNRI